MALMHLTVHDFRNLQAVDLAPSPSFNLFYGDNGSGKTSLLEAIHYLGLGRSFRSRLATRIMHHDAARMTVFGRVQDVALGIERCRNGKAQMRVANEPITSTAVLAEHLPVQCLHPESYWLLAGGPKERRQFIDWGVFHVKHSFLKCWQDVQRILKHRNVLLKQGAGREQLSYWDTLLVAAGESLDRLREEYLSEFMPVFERMWAELLPDIEVNVSYYRGWGGQHTLSEALAKSFLHDQAQGVTRVGPHRADLRFTVGASPASDVLSRGQQKMLVYALRLAQGQQLQNKMKKKCVYLLDDLPSELDVDRQNSIVALLEALDAQVFITGIAQESMAHIAKRVPSRMFHVKHGEVFELGTNVSRETL